MAVDPTVNSLNYSKQGGAAWEVGGALNILSGGTFTAQSGSTIDLSAATLVLPAAGVTGAKLDLSSLKVLSGTGSNGAGTVTATGLSATDRVIAAWSAAGAAYTVGSSTSNTFSGTPASANTITQNSTSNLSAATIVFLALPAAS